MDPMTIAMILGTAMKAKGDIDKEKTDRAQSAVETAYSPWTGIKPGKVEGADTAGTLAGGIGSVASQGQAAENAAQNKELMNAYMENMKLQNQALMNKQAPGQNMQIYGAPEDKRQEMLKKMMQGQAVASNGPSPWMGISNQQA